MYSINFFFIIKRRKAPFIFAMIETETGAASFLTLLCLLCQLRTYNHTQTFSLSYPQLPAQSPRVKKMKKKEEEEEEKK